MLFLILLGAIYTATWLVPRRRRWDQRQRVRVALGVSLAVAGGMHLAQPLPFVQHLPEWVPAREGLVYATGALEIGLGGALLSVPQPRRRWVGYLVAGYLAAVFPANIYVAVAGVEITGQPGGPYPWLRLLFQPLFVWMALWATARETGGEWKARTTVG